ncbi:MAG: hypothetical protein ACK49N_00935, partial [Verrucomicrobiota bacterium]
GGDTGFELGGQVSSFSFHRSDFGGDLPLSDQLKFQQTSGSVLRDHFIQTLNAAKKVPDTAKHHVRGPEILLEGGIS